MILPLNSLVAEKYRVISVLGSGGMGTVYHVKQVHLNKDYALKILDVREQTDLAIRRFHMEAKTTAQLKHPNLVQVQDFGIYADEQPYLVMDLIRGETLSSVLKSRGALPISYVTALAVQLAEGLKYAHSIGVVHRDIKPGNIIVLNADQIPTSGTVKLVDFGIAKLLHDDSSQIQELTRTGEIFGSPIYMSPEQCQGTAIDQRTDIYSLGCVLFECLTGSPPFLADNAMTTMVKRLTHEPETLKEGSLGMDFPQTLERIVHKMLLLEPEHRYQSCDLLIEDFVNFENAGTESKDALASSQSNQNASAINRSRLFDLALVLATITICSSGMHYLDTKYWFHEQQLARATVAVKANKDLDGTNSESGIQAVLGGGTVKVPTMTVETINGHREQVINFPEHSGKLFQYGSRTYRPALGNFITDINHPLGIMLSESAAATPNFFRNLTDSYLNHVDFAGMYLTNNDSLYQIGKLKHLYSLVLTNCDGVTSLEYLRGMDCLRSIYATGTSVPSSEFLALKYLTKLQSLGFGPVSDPDVVLQAVQHSTIGTLDYKGPSSASNGDDGGRLRSLNSKDLEIIAKMPSVENLRLTNCRDVNDDNLHILMDKRDKELSVLYLVNCNITPKSIPLLATRAWSGLTIESDKDWSPEDIERLRRNVKHSEFHVPRETGISGMVTPLGKKTKAPPAIESF